MKHFKYKDIQLCLGVSHSAVSQWFAGITRPNLENMVKIRDQYGIPIDSWLDIKSYLKSMPEQPVHIQEETKNQLHQKESA